MLKRLTSTLVLGTLVFSGSAFAAVLEVDCYNFIGGQHSTLKFEHEIEDGFTESAVKTVGSLELSVYVEDTSPANVVLHIINRMNPLSLTQATSTQPFSDVVTGKKSLAISMSAATYKNEGTLKGDADYENLVVDRSESISCKARVKKKSK